MRQSKMKNKRRSRRQEEDKMLEAEDEAEDEEEEEDAEQEVLPLLPWTNQDFLQVKQRRTPKVQPWLSKSKKSPKGNEAESPERKESNKRTRPAATIIVKK